MDNNTNIQADHMREFIVFLVARRKADLINTLNRSGIYTVNPTPQQLVATTYNSITTNGAFKDNLANLMTNVAVTELNNTGNAGSGTSNNSQNPTVATSAAPINQFISGATGTTNNAGTNNSNASFSNEDGAGDTGSGFSSTGVGSFLDTLLSKDNINKYINTGLNVINQKANQKTTQEQIDLANSQLVSMQAAGTLGAGAQTTGSTGKTILIVVLVLGALGTGIYFMTRKKK